MTKHGTGKKEKFKIAVITVSSTRDMKSDKSGQWIEKHIKREGHIPTIRLIVKDNFTEISSAVTSLINQEDPPNCIIMTGGTGLSRDDITIETVSSLFRKELTAFGPAFTSLSLEDIDSAAIMSRSTAGIIRNTIVFCLPGSINACKLACKILIFPEIEHILYHI